MKDKSDPALLAYLEAENAYTEAVTEPLGALAQQIYDDIDARTLQTDLSVPEFTRHTDGRCFWYYARTTQGQNYPRYHRAPVTDRDHLPDLDAVPEGEELLVDVNELAGDSSFFALGVLTVSPDGNRLAYSTDTAGDERYDLRFVDLRSGSALDDHLPDVAAGGCWAGDDSFCYLTVDEAWRPDTAWRHVLGSDEEIELHHEPDERFWMELGSPATCAR